MSKKPLEEQLPPELQRILYHGTSLERLSKFEECLAVLTLGDDAVLTRDQQIFVAGFCVLILVKGTDAEHIKQAVARVNTEQRRSGDG